MTTRDESATSPARSHLECALCEPDVRPCKLEREMRGNWVECVRGLLPPPPVYTQMEDAWGCPEVTSQASESKVGILGHLAALVPC